MQSERKEETRDRAERGSVVRWLRVPACGQGSERSGEEDPLTRLTRDALKKCVPYRLAATWPFRLAGYVGLPRLAKIFF